jgi:hypothetical protein
MSPELAAALLGAFVGAVGGGAAPLAGSVIVNRLQLRREMRIRMYDELLPKLIDGHFTRSGVRLFPIPDKVPHPSEVLQTMREMERASVIAGRKEAERVRALRRPVLRWVGRYESDLEATETGLVFRGDWRELYKQGSEVGRALSALNEYLARKLV